VTNPDDRPLPPFPTDRLDAIRTHEWAGLEDNSRCLDCGAVLGDCEEPCSQP
jgi:hypothetical protein